MLTKGNNLKCQLADKLMNTFSDSPNMEHFICPVSLSRESQVPEAPVWKLTCFRFGH